MSKPAIDMIKAITPGPWSWVYADADCLRPIAMEGGDGVDVILASEDIDGPRAYVREADARLIAAAPDLLAACEATLAQLDYLVGLWGAEGITRRVQERLREAVSLAKAEGQP